VGEVPYSRLSLSSCRAEEQRALGTCLRAEAAARRLAHALALAGMSMIGFGFLCGECVLRACTSRARNMPQLCSRGNFKLIVNAPCRLRFQWVPWGGGRSA